MKTKVNVREFLTDDSLDLSMNDLQDVPVKEIAAIPKATSLDLSSNALTSLSTKFAPSLTHLVKLELAQNKLTTLPENFGLLVNLKHLDLFKNKLTTVPLSFGDLKSLRWLDLKENPLLSKVSQVVGPCTNSHECTLAARNIVSFMSDLQQRLEREKKRRTEIKIKQEQAELEMIEKRENKQKKKKKKALEKMENGLTQHEEGAAPNHTSETREEAPSKKTKNKPRNMAMQIISGFFKLLVYSQLFLLLTVFVISLIDESTYHSLKVKVNYLTKTASDHLPKEVVNAIKAAVTFSSRLVKIMVNQTSFIVHNALIFVTDYYKWLTTDEKVLAYMDGVKHYCHVAYIRTSDFTWTVYSQTAAYLKNVISGDN